VVTARHQLAGAISEANVLAALVEVIRAIQRTKHGLTRASARLSGRTRSPHPPTLGAGCEVVATPPRGAAADGYDGYEYAGLPVKSVVFSIMLCPSSFSVRAASRTKGDVIG
jgi:hypothetical protein